ncbi:uncharacterized protein P174DRAFT_427845 [Aspergillus novofumigatus IBT 16806]|uniref:Uncharacterized protein n=1 Tax=Aspergillus novofumigatus (strain IBT 16806) TaxID=1392255 RepID=A0A2I1CFA0_ASPN1|nr:uncharacterized protein P174DRAFT_427845 [Aspergillus novofumigatus IBT 16806]PKX96280.1 hypothetical protein P174DRAFT_427845 [Aspergillus novofumigatus IBT 16806]
MGYTSQLHGCRAELKPTVYFEYHTENEAIRLEDRLINSNGPGRSEVLPTAPGSNTVPDIVIHSIAEQADTLAAPLKPEVVESWQNSSDEGRVAEPVDLVMVEAASQPPKPPESEASIEHGLLPPEVTIPAHSHTPNDLDESRAKKVVTWINFEDWAKTMIQEEHKASLMPVPEPPITTELRAETASLDGQPITVMAESSQATTAQSARKILKPRIVV